MLIIARDCGAFQPLSCKYINNCLSSPSPIKSARLVTALSIFDWLTFSKISGSGSAIARLTLLVEPLLCLTFFAFLEAFGAVIKFSLSACFCEMSGA